MSNKKFNHRRRRSAHRPDDFLDSTTDSKRDSRRLEYGFDEYGFDEYGPEEGAPESDRDEHAERSRFDFDRWRDDLTERSSNRERMRQRDLKRGILHIGRIPIDLDALDDRDL